MDKHYTAYIKADCPFCIAAKEEFSRQRVSHTINIMDNNLEQLESLKEKWNHSTVPLILLEEDNNYNLIGGYTELKTHFSGNKND